MALYNFPTNNNFMVVIDVAFMVIHLLHSYDILGAGMLWKPKEARILPNFNEC